ncbi:hypothetical protein J6590_066862 [Homalodisca vitripennis]|nr:hypothetical protein J6590_066862 [Homalodisca vitripennis]
MELPTPLKGSDNRGREEPPNKTCKDWINKIKAHIETFTTMESHYCRKDTEKKYLDSLFSINRCLICLNYESATDDEKKLLQASYDERIIRKNEANDSKDYEKK